MSNEKMSNEKQETIADIVAEMRDESHAGDASCLEWVGSKMRSYADRIEAAEKREREAGAEAAQICGEIGEMVGREAACRQPVTDCHGLNAAAMREALESVRNWCINRLVNSSHQVTIEGLLSVVNTALSKPPRNCDVGTADEQAERLDRWCDRKNFKACWGIGCRECLIAWAQMPYEEVGTE